MDSFHLCRYLTFIVCTVWHNIHIVRSSVTATCVQQNACSRGTVDIEHIYWDNTILLKILCDVSPSYAELAAWYIHSDFFLPQRNITQVIIKITVIILSYISICYLLCHLFPSHYMLSFDILLFSFPLPAPTAIYISGQQRTAHDANSTYLTVLLFSHIVTKRHKTLLLITRLSTAHEDWTFRKWQWTANMDPLYTHLTAQYYTAARTVPDTAH